MPLRRNVKRKRIRKKVNMLLPPTLIGIVIILIFILLFSLWWYYFVEGWFFYGSNQMVSYRYCYDRCRYEGMDFRDAVLITPKEGECVCHDGNNTEIFGFQIWW